MLKKSLEYITIGPGEEVILYYLPVRYDLSN
jgi:hypothetical protein